MPALTAAQVIKRAKSALSRRGRARRALLDHEGHCCAIGALLIGAGYRTEALIGEYPSDLQDEGRLDHALEEALLLVANEIQPGVETMGGCEGTIWRVNDDDRTSDRDIQRLFTKALKKAERQEAAA